MAIGTTFFEKIRGKSGNIEYRTRMNKKIEVAARRIPPDMKTTEQLDNRDRYKGLKHAWTDWQWADKTQYDVAGRKQKVSNWNLWIARHMHTMHLNPSALFACSEGKGDTVHNFRIGDTNGMVQAAAWDTTQEALVPILNFGLGPYYVSCPDWGGYEIMVGQSASWIMWYRYPPSETALKYVFEKMETIGGNLQGYHTFILGSGRMRFMIHASQTGAPVSQQVTSKKNTRDGSWHCIGITYDEPSSKMELYLDGKPEGVSSTKIWTDATNTKNLYLGSNKNMVSSFISIGEWAMWNSKKLSDEEILTHYEKTKKFYR